MTGLPYTAQLSGKVMVIRLWRNGLNSRFPERDREDIRDLLVAHRQVVLDFGDVIIPAVTELKLIVEWLKVSKAAGNFLVLAQCSRQMLSLLGILRISRDIAVVSNLQAALAHFQAEVNAVGHHT